MIANLKRAYSDANFTLALWLYNHRPFKRHLHTTWIRFLWYNGVRPY